MNQYEFFKQIVVTDDGYVSVTGTTGSGSPIEGAQYEKIEAITFDVSDNLNVIVDDSAYTEASIDNQFDFWSLLKVVDGKIVVCTI